MNEKITLQDIVNLLCEKQGISPKEAETFVRAMFDLIEEALANEKYVKIKGLGTFKLTEVNSRESVHVNTGERIEIQGHSKVSFTPDTSMKELINKPFSHFETVVLNEGVELEDTIVENETPEATEITETVVAIEESVMAHIEDVTPTEEPVIDEPIIETPTTEEPIHEELVAEEVIVEEVVVEESIIEQPNMEESTQEEPETIVEESHIEADAPIIEESIIEEVESQCPVEETIIETTEIETPEAKKETEEEKPISIEEKEEAPADLLIPQDEEKNSYRILWGVIIALVLIILFGCYWLFMRPDTSNNEAVPTTSIPEEVVEPIVVEEEEQVEDTLEIVQYVKLSSEELRNERVPSLADTLDYQIIGTKEEYTLQKGETIIRASVKFFGTKKYWPYIVKHNMDTLKDPDNIPAGAHIKIPVLTPKK